jgi:hypothetical protein
MSRVAEAYADTALDSADALREALQQVADLKIERLANRDTIRQLQQTLVDVNEHNDVLQDMLDVYEAAPNSETCPGQPSGAADERERAAMGKE